MDDRIYDMFLCLSMHFLVLGTIYGRAQPENKLLETIYGRAQPENKLLETMNGRADTPPPRGRPIRGCGESQNPSAEVGSLLSCAGFPLVTPWRVGPAAALP